MMATRHAKVSLRNEVCKINHCMTNIVPPTLGVYGTASFLTQYFFIWSHPLYPMIQPNVYIEELIQNITSRARMNWVKLTMFLCLQAIIGGVVSRDFAEK